MVESRWKGATVVILSCYLLIFLGTPGVAFLTTPAREPSPSGWFFVGQLSSIPENGVPQRLPLLAPQVDAWARHHDDVVGYVFVRRIPGSQKIIALRTEHHDGFRIPVTYDDQAEVYRSKCWDVQFDLNGKEITERGKAGMGERMESLSVEVAGDGIFVKPCR
jgi:hypothetical protein